jgi:hypothetical protein
MVLDSAEFVLVVLLELEVFEVLLLLGIVDT